MPRLTNPQPGNKYKVVCMDEKKLHKEVEFTFINITTNDQYQVKVNGATEILGDFCDLCTPWACEIHTV